MFKETRLEFSRTLPSPLSSPLFKYISATAKSDVCEARTNKWRWRTQKSGIDKTNEQALAVQIYMQHPACFSTPSTDTFAEISLCGEPGWCYRVRTGLLDSWITHQLWFTSLNCNKRCEKTRVRTPSSHRARQENILSVRTSLINVQYSSHLYYSGEVAFYRSRNSQYTPIQPFCVLEHTSVSLYQASQVL